jgi:hypothetical protein
MLPIRPMMSSLGSFWHRGQRVERAGYLVGALLLTSGLLHLGILIIGGSSWQGPLSLRKPMAFGLSFGLTLITIVWVASFLQLGNRRRALLLGAFTAACVLETALVSVQAWRGVPSHFNVATPFDASIARALAAGGFVLVAVIIVLTRAAFRPTPGVPISLRIAIQIGFVALCLAMATGAAMIARGMSLVFAGSPEAAYATGGTLKPTHAVTMHAILVLPALAWILSFANWSERQRVTMVLVAAAGYIVLVAVVAAGNAAGLDPDQLPIAADVLSVLGAALLVGTSAAAVFGVARDPASRGGIQHS